jgi:hypothetical protein
MMAMVHTAHHHRCHRSDAATHFISFHRSTCSGAMKIEGAGATAMDGGRPPDAPESQDSLPSTSLAARPRRDVVHFKERLMGYFPQHHHHVGFIAFGSSAHTATYHLLVVLVVNITSENLFRKIVSPYTGRPLLPYIRRDFESRTPKVKYNDCNYWALVD